MHHLQLEVWNPWLVLMCFGVANDGRNLLDANKDRFAKGWFCDDCRALEISGCFEESKFSTNLGVSVVSKSTRFDSFVREIRSFCVVFGLGGSTRAHAGSDGTLSVQNYSCAAKSVFCTPDGPLAL